MDKARGAVFRGLVLAGAILVFFGAPLIITYDSGHYLSYLPILSGAKDLSSWDVGRGPGFPVWLALIRWTLGTTPSAALAVSFLCLGLAIASGASVLRRISTKPRAVVLLGSLFFACDPTVFGYYHTLLTEYVAATIFVIGLTLASYDLEDGPHVSKRSMLLCLSSAALAVFAYHVKQPLVAGVIFPMSLAAIWRFRFFCDRRVGAKYFATPVLGLVAVGLSIAVWAAALPKVGPAADGTRMTSSLINNTLAATCVRSATGLFESIDSKVSVCPDERWRSVPSAAVGLGLEAACADGVLSGVEAASVCVRAIAASPVGFVRVVFDGLTDLWSFKSFSEHKLIAHRVYAVGPGTSVYYWVTDEVRGWVTSYEQPDATAGAAARLLGKLSWLSLRLHAVVEGLCFPLAALGWWWVFRRRSDSNTIAHAILFVAANSTAVFLCALSIMGTTLDRYAFPTFQISTIAAAAALVIVTRRHPRSTLGASSSQGTSSPAPTPPSERSTSV